VASFDEFLAAGHQKPNGRQIDGSFECQHCDSIAVYAVHDPRTKRLTWVCKECNGVSEINEFPGL
jgi:transcription elongation factor Elf1